MGMKLRKLELFRNGLGQPPLTFGPEGSGCEVIAKGAWTSSADTSLHVDLTGGRYLIVNHVPFILTMEPSTPTDGP